VQSVGRGYSEVSMLEKTLRLLRDVLDEVHDIARTFRFSSGNSQHRVGASHLGVALGQTTGVLAA